mgnify:CR=1 FL=1
MSDVEDNNSDILDEEYIDEDYNDDDLIDDNKVKKTNIIDEEDEEYDLVDEDDEILKKQFEIEQEDINNSNIDTIFVIPNNERMTSEKLTSYEIAEIINFRAVNISQGGCVYTNVEGIDNPIDMAKKELIDRKCPLYIKRSVGCNENGNLIEKWSPNECIFDLSLDD